MPLAGGWKFSEAWAKRIVNQVRLAEKRPAQPRRDRNERRPAGDNWFWAKIVCEGPDGEADFADNRYWFKRAYVSNDGGPDDTSAIEFTTFEDDDDYSVWDYVTNLFEECGTSHKIRPDTHVKITWDYDQSDPPVPRYSILTGDEGTCTDACETPNKCWTKLEVIYHCDKTDPEEQWGEITSAGTTCRETPAKVGSWNKASQDGPDCTYEYFIPGVCTTTDDEDEDVECETCADDGECSDASPIDWPEHPETAEDCGPTIPCPPSSGPAYLKSIDGVIQWVTPTSCS